MILLGTEFRDALLAELTEAEKKIPLGGERTFLKQVRDLINSPQYNFFMPEEKNTQLLRSVAMTDALIKLCNIDPNAEANKAPQDVKGWGRSIYSWASAYSGAVSPSVQNAVAKVLSDPRFDRPALLASDLDAGAVAAELLEMPEYKNNPNNDANKILKRFWAEQVNLSNIEQPTRTLTDVVTSNRPKVEVASVVAAQNLRKEQGDYPVTPKRPTEEQKVEATKKNALEAEKRKAFMKEKADLELAQTVEWKKKHKIAVEDAVVKANRRNNPPMPVLEITKVESEDFIPVNPITDQEFDLLDAALREYDAACNSKNMTVTTKHTSIQDIEDWDFVIDCKGEREERAEIKTPEFNTRDLRKQIFRHHLELNTNNNNNLLVPLLNFKLHPENKSQFFRNRGLGLFDAYTQNLSFADIVVPTDKKVDEKAKSFDHYKKRY